MSADGFDQGTVVRCLYAVIFGIIGGGTVEVDGERLRGLRLPDGSAVGGSGRAIFPVRDFDGIDCGGCGDRGVGPIGGAVDRVNLIGGDEATRPVRDGDIPCCLGDDGQPATHRILPRLAALGDAPQFGNVIFPRHGDKGVKILTPGDENDLRHCFRRLVREQCARKDGNSHDLQLLFRAGIAELVGHPGGHACGGDEGGGVVLG